MHESPGWQALPHAPQLDGSLCVFAQKGIPLNWHEVKGGVHGGSSKGLFVQVPSMQNGCPTGQTLPHAPQLNGSLVVFRQMGKGNPLSGQLVKGGVHGMPASLTGLVQVLLMQNGCPAGQTLPHAPQLRGSLLVTVQKGIPLIGQLVVGGKHVMPASLTGLVQVLLMQNGCPAGQTLPHAPQLNGLLVVSTQKGTPLIGQLVKGGVHVMPASLTGLVHVPLMQNGCPVGQTLPHAPQLRGSLLVTVQKGIPLIGQLVVGGKHVMPASLTRLVHMLLMQNGWPDGQTLPHAPQLVGSLVVSRQTGKGIPLTGQEVKGGGHGGTPASLTGLLVQLPLMQNGCPVGQTLPHAPQLNGSLAWFTQKGNPLTGQFVNGGVQG